MAAYSGDMVGYLCVLFLMKLTLFDPMLMGRFLMTNPCPYWFLTDTDILISAEKRTFFLVM